MTRGPLQRKLAHVALQEQDIMKEESSVVNGLRFIRCDGTEYWQLTLQSLEHTLTPRTWQAIC